MCIRFTGLVVVCLLVAVPSQASAQRAATSFEELSLLIGTGDTITVRDSNGVETTGKLGSLTAHGLTIVSDGRPREWGDGDVSRIFQRKPDSLANGALWGLAGGAGASGALAAIVCYGEGCDPLIAVSIAVYAGLGAAVGVGIDSLIKESRMIYEQPSRSAALTFAPILTHGKRGVMLMVKY